MLGLDMEIDALLQDYLGERSVPSMLKRGDKSDDLDPSYKSYFIGFHILA